MKHYTTLAELNHINDWPPSKNNMICIQEVKKFDKLLDKEFTTDFYLISLESIKSVQILYGNAKYEPCDTTLNFYAPGQVVNCNNLSLKGKLWLLFIRRNVIKAYLDFYNDRINLSHIPLSSALYLLPKEHSVIEDIYRLKK